MNTLLEEASISKNWIIFLKSLEQLAFEELNLHKIYNYAFDLRPHHYDVQESIGYVLDDRLKKQIGFDI